MKEIKLKVPDDKLKFFLKLTEKLGFETREEVMVSKAHKSLVRERIASYEKKPARLIAWKEFQQNF